MQFYNHVYLLLIRFFLLSSDKNYTSWFSTGFVRDVSVEVILLIRGRNTVQRSRSGASSIVKRIRMLNKQERRRGGEQRSLLIKCVNKYSSTVRASQFLGAHLQSFRPRLNESATTRLSLLNNSNDAKVRR